MCGMDTQHTSSTARSRLERLLPMLYDRASLEGLECQDSGWDEWDAVVAEQDLREQMRAEVLSVG